MTDADVDIVAAPALPSVYVPRPRLVAQLRDCRVALLLGGGGWGKSALARELAQASEAIALRISCRGDGLPGGLASALADSARRSGHVELAAALGRVDGAAGLVRALTATSDAVLMVVDDLEDLLDTVAAVQLIELAEFLPRPHQLVLAGRQLSKALVPIGLAVERTLGIDALALEPEELALLARELGVDLGAGALASLHEWTGGWVAASLLALRVPGEPGAGVAALLDRLLAPLGSDARNVLGVLASLPLLDESTARAIGAEDVLGEALRRGLPVRPLQGRWLEVANPARDLLARGRTPSAAQLEAVACAYAGKGELRTAARLLLAGGLDGALAALIATTPDHALLAMLGREAIDLVEALHPDVLAAHPRALLSASWICSVLGQTERRQALVDRMASVASRDAVDARLVAAERAHDLAWRHADLERSRRLASCVLEEAGEQELESRGRAHEALARCSGAVGPAHERTWQEYTRAAGVWQRLEEPAREAWVLTWRAVQAEWDSGHHERAIATLDEALVLARANPHVRVLVLPFRAMVLVDVGRYQEAQRTITEAQRLAATLGTPVRAAYAAWAAARAASQQGDADATRAAIEDATRLGLDDSGGGWLYAADCAQLLERVGLSTEADVQLATALAGDDGHREHSLVAQLVVAARRGDAATAETAHRSLECRHPVSRRDGWRLTLLRAWVAREAEPARATRLAVEAFEGAAALGTPRLPLVREPDVARGLLPLAVAGGSPSAVRLQADGVATIRLLGGFAVTDLGRDVTPAAGMPAQALAYVALAGRGVTVDQLMDALWPAADPAKGRERLRVVLYRLRAEVGDLVRRDGDLVRLSPGVVVDAGRFDHLAGGAIARDDGSVAEAALAAYGGELLPDWRYVDWADAPRRRLSWRHLAVLDVLIEHAEAAGDLDRAVRLLQLGIELEPLGEERAMHVADLLQRQGRRLRARGVLVRVEEALTEAGLTGSAGLRARIEELSRAA